MKRYLGKIAVVAVALVAVLSCQSEAAVLSAHAHHGGANVHHVVKAKHQHKKVKSSHVHHVCRPHKHGLLCLLFGC